MQTCDQEMTDVARYIKNHRHITLEDKRPHFEHLIATIERHKKIGPNTRILEIGIGTGWFPLLCKQNGIPCQGLEISPELVAYAREFGAQYGLVPDIAVGSIEDTDLGASQYDVIIAFSVFEHVKQWPVGLDRVYRALAPGGLLFFISTNKFSPKSGEYPLPFYGWLPDALRYRLRVARQGPSIMDLGIDFNQFTYRRLRRFFRKQGYAKVLDWFDLVDRTTLDKRPLGKRTLMKLALGFRPAKHLMLCFVRSTVFICIK